jgi:uncharacterized protein YbjQ (UPF0145 family)
MEADPGAMLVATVPSIEGRPIQWYLGVVSGDAVVEQPQIRDEKGLREARRRAICAMLAEAAERGANAVLGVGLGCERIDHDGGVALMLTASGTAVRV